MITKCLIYVLVKSHNPLVRNLKLNFSNEDLKMKKLLLNLLVIMSKDLAALQVSHTQYLCNCLNKYLNILKTLLVLSMFSSPSFIKKKELCLLC